MNQIPNIEERVEEIVEQYAQSIQDMYFLEGAKISTETWKNTKDFIRNALTQELQKAREEEREKMCQCNCAQRPHAWECALNHCCHAPTKTDR